MTHEATIRPSCDELAIAWLAAEERVLTEPLNEQFARDAARLGEEYDDAVGEASQEELRLAWEAAKRRQGAEEMGSRRWADARRVSELLRTEYVAARTRDEEAVQV